MYLTVTTTADLVDPSDGRLSLREAVARPVTAKRGGETGEREIQLTGSKVLTAGDFRF
ncbi:MAG: hypothetical protein WAS21_32065 [Geminicoccaceae bacterium]